MLYTAAATKAAVVGASVEALKGQSRWHWIDSSNLLSYPDMLFWNGCGGNANPVKHLTYKATNRFADYLQLSLGWGSTAIGAEKVVYLSL
jgi:hypothetical protein